MALSAAIVAVLMLLPFSVYAAPTTNTATTGTKIDMSTLTCTADDGAKHLRGETWVQKDGFKFICDIDTGKQVILGCNTGRGLSTTNNGYDLPLGATFIFNGKTYICKAEIDANLIYYTYQVSSTYDSKKIYLESTIAMSNANMLA